MKRIMKRLGGLLCAMLMLVCLCPAALAADQKPYDCTVFIFGGDDTGQIVNSGVGVLVQAGDGGGYSWVVSAYAITSGATQFAVQNPRDTEETVLVSLVAGDADSGIAVFRLEQQLSGRMVAPMRTLDGLNEGDTVLVAGISQRDNKMYLSSIPGCLSGTAKQGNYTFLTVVDGGDTGLDGVGFLSMSAVMDMDMNVLGFYVASHTALPCGYIMTQADGIGTLGKKSADDPEPAPEPETPSGSGSGSGSNSTGAYSVETVQSNTGVADLLAQANAQKAQAKAMQTVMVMAAVLIAAGIVLLAVRRSRKASAAVDARTVSSNGPAQSPGRRVESMGKTEYAGGSSYGKTGLAAPIFQIIPLPGTPGAAQLIPGQGLTFGRSLECSVSFAPDTGGVSGRHCSLFWQGGQLMLRDDGSSYGTLLEDGRKLSSGESAVLSTGDKFYLGSRKIGFQVQEK